MHALSVDDLHAGYAGTPVLTGVSLHVRSNEILAIVGPNGSGKTTLLRGIAGSIVPTAGSVQLHEHDIAHLPVHRRTQLGLGHVPEGRGVFPSLSTRDNLLVGATGSGLGSAEVGDRLAFVLELFPRLGDRLTQRLGDLSGGEQQMVGLGRALMGNPSVLMLDEPSVGLAPLIVQSLLDAVVELRSTLGLAVLLVEQRAEEVLHACDRAYVLVHGRIVVEVEGAALDDVDEIRRAYFSGVA